MANEIYELAYESLLTNMKAVTEAGYIWGLEAFEACSVNGLTHGFARTIEVRKYDEGIRFSDYCQMDGSTR